MCMVSPVPAALVPLAPCAQADAGARALPEPQRQFASVMQDAISQVSHTHSQAHDQLQTFRLGQGELRWDEVAQSLDQARQSLQEMMQLRGQLVSVYRGLKADQGQAP